MNDRTEPPPPAQGTSRAVLGKILVRGVVPAWVLAGAAFKLWERNPQLLPKPVTDVTDLLLGRTFGIPRETYLDPAMRAMVAVEILVALVMVVGPLRIARALGVGILGLFCLILLVLLASGAASCGCFGSSGPSPGWMLAIDGTLLGGLLFLPRMPAASDAVLRRWGALVPVAGALAAIVAFAVPAREAVVLPQAGVESGASPAPAPHAPQDTPKAATAEPAPPVPGPAPVASAPWPPMPATAKPWYAPEFDEWKGKRLDAQELMLLVPRPLPANLNAGRHHVVFMREDCEHCHALLTQYFSASLDAPTMTIAVPDATGELLENPCGECTKATLPGGITYVFSTPVLLTVQDGIVVGVCTDAENADLVRTALNAK